MHLRPRAVLARAATTVAATSALLAALTVGSAAAAPAASPDTTSGTTVSASAVAAAGFDNPTGNITPPMPLCNSVDMACQATLLYDIDAARALEGVGPMILPSGFASMSGAEQQLVITNSERAARGLPTFSGLDPELNVAAQDAAPVSADPTLPAGYPANGWGSIWAGVPSALYADYLWMYDDGLDSGNLQCTPADPGACWSHRDNILGSWQSTPNGAATPAMGAAEVDEAVADQWTQIFAANTAPGGPTSIQYPYASISVPANNAPYLLSLSPTSGSPSGSGTVKLEGIGFRGATNVSFGNVAATFTVVSDNEIVAHVPQSAVNGAVEVSVTSPQGTSPADGGASYTYGCATSAGARLGSAAGISATEIDGCAGYYVTNSAGDVSAFGSATFHGDLSGVKLNAPIISITATAYGGGYWLLAADGGVFNFGDAGYFGSTGNLALNAPVVGMAVTPDGGGYWIIAKDGGVFTYGDATFHGSTGGLTLNQPVDGIAVGPGGAGYWLVASDGGVFAFDEPFIGSLGDLTLNRPIIGMSSDAAGNGYTLVGSDGGVFNFNTPYFGSLGANPPPMPVVALATAPDGGGYYLVDTGGAVFTFGDAVNLGDV
jgi:hypothetical protein